MNNDDAVIAELSRQVIALSAWKVKAQERFAKIRSYIYCVGGPLNDNKLGYSRRQMQDFARIADLADLAEVEG